MKVILIDLDKTLYDPKTGIFDEINYNIKVFIKTRLKIGEDLIDKLRSDYVKTYGSTLMGLMKHFNINPYEFLDFAHNVDLSSIEPSSTLKEKLKAIKGTKVIFTSAPKKHAQNVLERLDVLNEFDDIFDIIEAEFIAKPNKQPYIKVLQKHKAVHYTMVDDMEQNLLTAKLFGVKTILVNKNKSQHVDLCVEKFEDIPVDFL